MNYTYAQFNAFLKASSKAWVSELSDLTWSAFVASKVDGKKLQEILHSLKG